MANTNAPFGFRQVRGTGSAPTYEQIVGNINYNTAGIYRGDPIQRYSDGTLVGNTTGNIGGGAAGVAAIAGIFYGCAYLSASQGRIVWSNYWPGSDVNSGNVVTGYFVNDPNAQFIVQAGNSSSTGVVTGNIGSNVQFLYGTGSANVGGQSGAYIDVGNIATTSTLPFRITGLVTSPPGGPGTASGAYNWVQVAFNNIDTKNLNAPG